MSASTPAGPDSPLVGAWAYRSFDNDPDLEKSFDDLEFGQVKMPRPPGG